MWLKIRTDYLPNTKPKPYSNSSFVGPKCKETSQQTCERKIVQVKLIEVDLLTLWIETTLIYKDGVGSCGGCGDAGGDSGGGYGGEVSDETGYVSDV
jgi:hypothetical protein